MNKLFNIAPLLLALFTLTAFSQVNSNSFPKNDINYIDTVLSKKLSYNDVIVYYADSGNFAAVDFLLKTGISPNSCLEGNYSALMYAAQNGNYDIAKLLIDYGADLNIVPYDGNTALFAAVRSNNDSIAELLLDNGAIVNLLNTNGLSPLHYASGFGYPYLVELLLYFGSSIDTTDFSGNTPLLSAVYSGAFTSAQILINQGADVNKTDIYGNTPLMIAAQFNDTTLIKLLYKAGADINRINNRKVNALSFAIQNNSFEACELLLGLGADTIKDFTGKSYYQQSVESNNKAISELFKNRNLKTRLKPTISSYNFYSGFTFSNSDFMFDFGGGVYEPVSRIMINIGYKYRPVSSRIIEYRDNSFYQFWEKRYAFYLSLQHLHELKKNYHNGNFGFIAGFNGELTWRYLRGSNNDRANFVIVPNLGLYYQRDFFTIIGKWEVAKYKSEGIGFNRFGLQLLLTIPNTSKRVVNKNIYWLD
ncbi:MAG: ankyrin repeat domain-containing protein [Tenuifilaceae bacterium]